MQSANEEVKESEKKKQGPLGLIKSLFKKKSTSEVKDFKDDMVSPTDYGERAAVNNAQNMQHNVKELLGENPLEVSMGAMPEGERVFKVVDKDTGRVYDVRNEAHVERLNESSYQANMSMDSSPLPTEGNQAGG